MTFLKSQLYTSSFAMIEARRVMLAPSFMALYGASRSMAFCQMQSIGRLLLTTLTFVLDKDNEAQIFNNDGQQVFHDAAFVYFKTWEKMPEQAAALANYLFYKGIPFEDQIV